MYQCDTIRYDTIRLGHRATGCLQSSFVPGIAAGAALGHQPSFNAQTAVAGAAARFDPEFDFREVGCYQLIWWLHNWRTNCGVLF